MKFFHDWVDDEFSKIIDIIGDWSVFMKTKLYADSKKM